MQMPNPETAIKNSINSHSTRLSWKEVDLCILNVHQTEGFLQPQKKKSRFLPQFSACFSALLCFYFGFFYKEGKEKLKSTISQLWNSSGFELLENGSTVFTHTAQNHIIVETLKTVFGSALQEQLRQCVLVI